MEESIVVTLVTGAGAALTTAIVHLWRRQLAQAEKVEKRLETTETQLTKARDAEVTLIKENSTLSERITAVESKIEGYQEARSDLRELSEKVIVILDNTPKSDEGDS